MLLWLQQLWSACSACLSYESLVTQGIKKIDEEFKPTCSLSWALAWTSSFSNSCDLSLLHPLSGVQHRQGQGWGGVVNRGEATRSQLQIWCLNHWIGLLMVYIEQPGWVVLFKQFGFRLPLGSWNAMYCENRLYQFEGNCLFTTPYGSRGNGLSELCITTSLQLSSSIFLFALGGFHSPILLPPHAGLEEQEPRINTEPLFLPIFSP